VFWNKIHEKSSTEARQLDFPWSNKSVLNIGSKLPDIPNNHVTHLSDCVGIATQALQNNDFDYVWIVGGLEYSLEPWKCVQEAHRVLRKNGKIVLQGRGMQPKRPGEHFRFMPAGLKALADSSGFIPLNCDGFGSRELVLRLLKNDQASEAISRHIQGDDNFYLQSWYIGEKTRNGKEAYIHRRVGSGALPSCKSCMTFSKQIKGPGMLQWGNVPKNPMKISFDSPNMKSHILTNTAAYMPLKCGGIPCNKATRLPADSAIISHIRTSPNLIKVNQKILIISPPGQAESWALEMKEIVYAYTRWDGGYHESCESLPFANDQFDQVWSNMVLEHTIEPWTCFREMHRVLKNDGTAIVAAPSFYFMHVTHYPDAYRYYPSGLKALADYAQFSRVNVSGWGRRDFMSRLVSQDDNTNRKSESFRFLAQQPPDADQFYTCWIFATK
jgi:SAM-dependent methyltransferase